ncbi:hypothetical protein ABZ990_25465 [Streptomyces sp. NPDC046203]|uniref:hypothetical protein n=1 Tax=Streptomyces sp. NPDC046203 TaxID=3154602 RepID=UPI0033C8178D
MRLYARTAPGAAPMAVPPVPAANAALASACAVPQDESAPGKRPPTGNETARAGRRRPVPVALATVDHAGAGAGAGSGVASERVPSELRTEPTDAHGGSVPLTVVRAHAVR